MSRARALTAALLAALCGAPLSAGERPAANRLRAERPQVQRAQPGDSDQTLRAMRDEMERSRERLRIAELERPYFIEYRLLDVDVRTITATFGAILNTNSVRNRFMSVDVRVGDYRSDSSNFLSDDPFRGFIGSTGTVGIDRDYDSLRQDLWLATDQAYKEALDRLSRKRGYLRSLAQQPTTDDFSREQSVVFLPPRPEPDWTSRDWEAEARAASAVFRSFPELYSARVTYHLIFTTRYLFTSEGTQVRVSRSLAAIEASLDTQAGDGMGLHHFYAAYAPRPADLPATAAVRAALERVAGELTGLRRAALAEDYAGPVLVEAHAAGALLAQLLGPSVSGARSQLSMQPFVEQMLERLGGRSEWTGRMGARVFPTTVTLTDDPTAKEFRGQPLLGGYDVDEEGMRSQRVVLVENGILRNLLMSRRPGQDLNRSNGHGRTAFLGEARPAMTNLFFESSATLPAADLRKKFFDLCREASRSWCIVVKQMDNPALGFQRQDDFSDVFASLAGGAASGDRAPLLVYRVYVADGREELVRGSRLTGVSLRALRSLTAVGDDPTVFHFHQNPAPQLAGTALAAFGSAQGGLPTSVVAPSLLFEEMDVRGARGEPRRPPIVPPPPLN